MSDIATEELHKGNRGAFERLRAWPAIFNVNQAARYLGTPDNDSASVYLARWKKRRMIQSTGPRSGVYFNLVADPHAAQDKLVDALLLAFPSAVLIGASVLHSAGWTTQIPSKLQVACLGARDGRRSVPLWDEVAFFTRPKTWYGRLHSQISRDRSAGVLPALSPAAALPMLTRVPATKTRRNGAPVRMILTSRPSVMTRCVRPSVQQAWPKMSWTPSSRTRALVRRRRANSSECITLPAVLTLTTGSSLYGESGKRWASEVTRARTD
jgi:hypothetical protein